MKAAAKTLRYQALAKIALMKKAQSTDAQAVEDQRRLMEAIHGKAKRQEV
jgi:hypothetical protein